MSSAGIIPEPYSGSLSIVITIFLSFGISTASTAVYVSVPSLPPNVTFNPRYFPEFDFSIFFLPSVTPVPVKDFTSYPDIHSIEILPAAKAACLSASAFTHLINGSASKLNVFSTIALPDTIPSTTAVLPSGAGNVSCVLKLYSNTAFLFLPLITVDNAYDMSFTSKCVFSSKIYPSFASTSTFAVYSVPALNTSSVVSHVADVILYLLLIVTATGFPTLFPLLHSEMPIMQSSTFLASSVLYV